MLTGHLGEAGWAFGDRRLQCSQKARLGDEDLESSLSRKQGGKESRVRAYQRDFGDSGVVYLMLVLAACRSFSFSFCP